MTGFDAFSAPSLLDAPDAWIGWGLHVWAWSIA